MKKRLCKYGTIVVIAIILGLVWAFYVPMGEERFSTYSIICKSIITVAYIAFLLVFLTQYETIYAFAKDIIESRRLLVQLSKNDFKTRFAGSYLGIVWAFVQPIVTVFIYWFVFEKGLRSGGVSDVPYVLWLIAGIVPWFFFSEALSGGTNSLMEYQYLVKKVVFRIDILPMVKVISSMFVHVFFVTFMLLLYCCYRQWPSVYTIQVIYYSFCVLVLALGISYITSAIVVFFRDLTQVVSIVLQVGMWATPIMWNIELMDIPVWLRTLFKFNPVFYIVQGYRDSLINHVWFWQRTGITLYFWCVTLVMLMIGVVVFKKLKVHFADVI